MTIQQMLLNDGGSALTPEWYYSSRMFLDPNNTYGSTNGEYPSFQSTPQGAAISGKYFYNTATGQGGGSYMTSGWQHSPDDWDMIVIRLQAVNSNYVYLDAITGSTISVMTSGSPPISNFNSRVVICDLGTSGTTTAQASNIIQDYTYNYTARTYNQTSAPYDYINTGDSNDPTPKLYAAYGTEHYYAICLDMRSPTGSSEYITNGSYADNNASYKSVSGLSSVPTYYSSIVWNDGTHAFNVWYMDEPNHAAPMVNTNYTNHTRGQLQWYQWRRAE